MSFASTTSYSTPRTSASELKLARKLTRQTARSHYENFLVGSVLLPRRMRQPFYDVYAFCRTADDLADDSSSPEQAIRDLNDYRLRIASVFAEGPAARRLQNGRVNEMLGSETPPGEAADRRIELLFLALSDTVHRFGLPREPFDDLLDAFLQDQTVDRYCDESSLLEYCRRSANPVGRLVLAMAGCDSSENVRLSDEICTALQLVNFWQDMARDYAIGRIYLPASVMHRHGFDESLIASTIDRGRATPECVREAIASQCGQARMRLERGRPLVRNVSPWLAADLELIIRGGLATLDAIENTAYDVLRYRPTVGKTKQAYLVACTWLRTISGGSGP